MIDRPRKPQLDPTLVNSIRPKPADPTPTTAHASMNLSLPKYLMKQLRVKATADDSSVKYEIMRGLKRLGYDIHDADMIKDRRRGRRTKK